MKPKRNIILLLGAERKSAREILRGIICHSSGNYPWMFYREPPFYRKYPYGSATGLAQEMLTHFQGLDADGIIAFVPNPTQAQALLSLELPAVFIPMVETIPGHCCILEEPLSVGRLAAEHLLDRGYRNFAFCGLDNNYWSGIRKDGFTQRIQQAGFTVDLFRLNSSSEPVTWESEYHQIVDWLRTLPNPIGLMAFNDERAQQVVEACRIAELRIPDDIAIIGVDNDDILCDLSNPPISSIAMNFQAVGCEAAEQLERQMNGLMPTIQSIYVRPSYVVTRQSTDIVAIEDAHVATALRFIRAHAQDIISVEDVVNSMIVSRRVLERHFKCMLGRSIQKEIERVHLERASQLLISTDWPLSKIARHCGFSGTNHLGAVFRRLMHRTPSQYRSNVAFNG
jgi:LacI family transcriptional regulator